MSLITMSLQNLAPVLHPPPAMFKCLKNKRGQGMTEYIIIVALIAIAAIGILELLGGTVRVQFGKIAASLQGTEYSGGNFHEQGEIDARTKSRSLKDFDK